MLFRQALRVFPQQPHIRVFPTKVSMVFPSTAPRCVCVMRLLMMACITSRGWGSGVCALWLDRRSRAMPQKLTRTLRTVLRLSLRILTVTLTSSPWVYQPLSKLALKPPRPSCSRKGLSTDPWGPPQGPTLTPPIPPVTPAPVCGGNMLSQCWKSRKIHWFRSNINAAHQNRPTLWNSFMWSGLEICFFLIM